MEAFTTLLGGTIVHVLRDADPVVRTLFADELEEKLIFFGDPRATAVGGSHGGWRREWRGGEEYTKYTMDEAVGEAKCVAL